MLPFIEAHYVTICNLYSMQTRRIWRRCADETWGPRLWGLPGTRLQTCCQRALWSRCPWDHIQEPQVSHEGSCWRTLLLWCPNRYYFYHSISETDSRKIWRLQQTGGTSAGVVFTVEFNKVALSVLLLLLKLIVNTNSMFLKQIFFCICIVKCVLTCFD